MDELDALDVMDDLDEFDDFEEWGRGMSKKIAGSVSADTRKRLQRMAAAEFDGGIGKATMHVVRLALASPQHPITMTAGDEVTCSVNVDEDLVAEIKAFQVAESIAKRTEATKRLIETGLSIVDAREPAPGPDKPAR